MGRDQDCIVREERGASAAARGIRRTGVWVGVMAATAAVGMAGGIGGCERKGPAERAGENIDRAVEDVGEAIRDAGRGN